MGLGATWHYYIIMALAKSANASDDSPEAAESMQRISAPSAASEYSPPSTRRIFSALDRLQPLPSDRNPSSIVAVPAFICVMSTLAVRTACTLLDQLLPSSPIGTLRLVAELATSIFLIDFVSGVLHAALDFSDPGHRLRHLIPKSKAAVHTARRTDPAFAQSSAWAQAVWNFQAHHYAPYPEHDNQWVETAYIASPLLLGTLLQHCLGWLSPQVARVWTMTLALGHGVQASHFLAHRRVHLGASALPRAVVLLQDIGLLLHPRVHRIHHETFDCNFCIFNGWANPIVNAGFRAARALGAVDVKLALHPRPAAAAPPAEEVKVS